MLTGEIWKARLESLTNKWNSKGQTMMAEIQSNGKTRMVERKGMRKK